MGKKSKHPHRNLDAWKKSMDLVETIYQISTYFPADERYGLSSQIKRAAISVPSNIAEGAGRRTNAEFINFLSIAIGSLSELDTQIELAKRLKFIDDNTYISANDQIDSCKGLIFGLRRYIMNQKE